jgi:UDP-galactopyranose mutase
MQVKYDYLIVGCGFSGIVLAERLSSIGKTVLIIDKRDHIGGNCYDYKDKKIFVHKYGPHIFHTKNRNVFEYLNKFTRFNNYNHKVLAYYDKKYFPMPINLNTVNKFFNINLKNEEELKQFLENKRKKINKISNSEDVIISKFGKELYEAFVKTYTKKQWDKYPSELDKSVLERLPVRYNKNDSYFDDPFQGMPTEGYTKMFHKMLSNRKISIKLNTSYIENMKDVAKNIIWTGKIDEYFKYKFKKLDYRSVNFIFEKYKIKNFLPNSVVNFPEEKFNFLRITEFKKFYNVKSKKTIICREFFRWGGEPIYPINDKKNAKVIKRYLEESEKEKNVYFLGRLGRYKYINMDQCVQEALELFEKINIEN